GPELHGIRRGEGVVVLEPEAVVEAVVVAPAGQRGVDGGQQVAGPGRRLLVADVVRVGMVGDGELADLVAKRHARDVRALGELGAEHARQLVLGGDDVDVGEDVPIVPGRDPGGQEVVAGQMALQQVDGDLQAMAPGDVHDGEHVLDGGRGDQG